MWSSTAKFFSKQPNEQTESTHHDESLLFSDSLKSEPIEEQTLTDSPHSDNEETTPTNEDFFGSIKVGDILQVQNYLKQHPSLLLAIEGKEPHSTGIHYAVALKEEGILEVILEKLSPDTNLDHKEYLNKKDSSERTALMVAFEDRNLRAFDLLLRAGADPGKKCHSTLLNQEKNIIQLALDREKCKDCDEFVESILQLSECKEINTDVMNTLLENACKSDSKDHMLNLLEIRERKMKIQERKQGNALTGWLSTAKVTPISGGELLKLAAYGNHTSCFKGLLQKANLLSGDEHSNDQGNGEFKILSEDLFELFELKLRDVEFAVLGKTYAEIKSIAEEKKSFAQGALQIVATILETGAINFAIEREWNRIVRCASTFNGINVFKVLNEWKTDIETEFQENPTKKVATNLDFNTFDEDDMTALMRAASGGYIEIVEFLTGEKVHIAQKNSDDMTALMFAAELDHFEVVKYLVNVDAEHKSLNLLNKDGETALILAFKKRSAKVAEYLLSQFFSNNEENLVTNFMLNKEHRNHKGETLLMAAAIGGLHEIVSKLVEKGVNVHTKNQDGNTALLLAIQNASVGVVDTLINKTSCNLNVVNKAGETALCMTSQPNIPDHDQELIAQKLIAAGASQWIKHQLTLSEFISKLMNPSDEVEGKDMAILKQSLQCLDLISIRICCVFLNQDFPKRGKIIAEFSYLNGRPPVKVDIFNCEDQKYRQSEPQKFDKSNLLPLFDAKIKYDSLCIRFESQENGNSQSDPNWFDLEEFWLETVFKVKISEELQNQCNQLFNDLENSTHELTLVEKQWMLAFDNEGNTLLMHASKEGRSDHVNLYLDLLLRTKIKVFDRCIQKHKFFLDKQNCNGDTALLLACQSHTPVLAIVKALIEAGSNVDMRNFEGKTALMVASLLKLDEHTSNEKAACIDEIIKSLEAAQSRTNITPIHHSSSTQPSLRSNLMNAVTQGTLERVLECLDKTDCVIDKQDEKGDTALIHVVRSICTESAANLKGKDKSQSLKVKNKTADGRVPTDGVNILNALLCAGADIECTNDEGDTPLLIASGGSGDNIDEIVTTLLDVGANINAINKNGSSPVLIACQKKSSPILKKLLSQPKVQLDLKNKEGNTALHLRLKNSTSAGQEVLLINFIKLLFSKKANVFNAINKDKETPLFLAYSSEYYDETPFQALILFGADPFSQNKEDKPLLKQAYDDKKREYFKALLGEFAKEQEIFSFDEPEMQPLLKEHNRSGNGSIERILEAIFSEILEKTTPEEIDFEYVDAILDYMSSSIPDKKNKHNPTTLAALLVKLAENTLSNPEKVVLNASTKRSGRGDTFADSESQTENPAAGESFHLNTIQSVAIKIFKLFITNTAAETFVTNSAVATSESKSVHQSKNITAALSQVSTAAAFSESKSVYQSQSKSKRITLKDDEKKKVQNFLFSQASLKQLSLIELLAEDLHVIDGVLEQLTLHEIELELAHSNFLKNILAKPVSYIQKFKHVTFYLLVISSFGAKTYNKEEEDKISKLAKKSDKIVDLCLVSESPLLVLIKTAAAMKRRAQESPMLELDCLKIKEDFLKLIQAAMDINTMDDVHNVILAFGGSQEDPLAFMKMGPLAFALKQHVEEFLALPAASELIELVWGWGRLIAALSPFHLEWTTEIIKDDMWSFELHRRLPCLRALVCFVLKMGFLIITLVLLFKETQQDEFNFLYAILCMLLTGYMFEEAYEMQSNPQYWTYVWNLVDVLVLLAYLYWLISVKTSDAVLLAGESNRIMLSFNVCFTITQVAEFFTVFPTTGLLLAVFIEMLTDVLDFLVLFGFTLFSFAIIFCISFKDVEEFNCLSSSLLTLISASLGNFEFHMFEGHERKALGILVYITFLITCSIMLMNLLIAVMSVTFTKNQDRQRQKYCALFARYVLGYYKPHRSVLPGPLSILTVFNIFKNSDLYSFGNDRYWLQHLFFVPERVTKLVVFIVDLAVSLAIIIPVCCVVEMYLMCLPEHHKRSVGIIQKKYCPFVGGGLTHIIYGLSILLCPLWFPLWFIQACGRQPKQARVWQSTWDEVDKEVKTELRAQIEIVRFHQEKKNGLYWIQKEMEKLFEKYQQKQMEKLLEKYEQCTWKPPSVRFDEIESQKPVMTIAQSFQREHKPELEKKECESNDIGVKYEKDRLWMKSSKGNNSDEQIPSSDESYDEFGQDERKMNESLATLVRSDEEDSKPAFYSSFSAPSSKETSGNSNPAKKKSVFNSKFLNKKKPQGINDFLERSFEEKINRKIDSVEKNLQILAQNLETVERNLTKQNLNHQKNQKRILKLLLLERSEIKT